MDGVPGLERDDGLPALGLEENTRLLGVQAVVVELRVRGLLEDADLATQVDVADGLEVLDARVRLVVGSEDFLRLAVLVDLELVLEVQDAEDLVAGRECYVEAFLVLVGVVAGLDGECDG